LKSGYILGATRKQFIAQFAGIFFGLLAIVPAWYAMVPTKKALEAFNPLPLCGKAVADLAHARAFNAAVTAIWAIVIAPCGLRCPWREAIPKRSLSAVCDGLGLSWVMLFRTASPCHRGVLVAPGPG